LLCDNSKLSMLCLGHFMDPAITEPLYVRVKQNLRNAIESGRFPAGSALPSEKQLETEHGVSRITVRRALEELEREGLVERGRGRQARVCEMLTSAIRTRMEDDLASILQLGRGMTAEVVSYAWRIPDSAIALKLAIPADEPVLHVERLRRRRGKSVLHTLAHVPASIGGFLPRGALEKATMLDVLAQKGIQAASVKQEMRAGPCAAFVAGLLDLPRGAPVFVLDRLVLDTADRPIQHLIATFRWDSFCYRVESKRQEGGRTVNVVAGGRIESP